MRPALIIVAALTVPAAAYGAARSSALTKVMGGLWEISGAPGIRAPVRECVMDVTALAQFEHRGQHCSYSVVKDRPSSTLIHYNCGTAGFGQSDVDVLTPRSLQIRTQGISEQLPFSYVLQARRVGECTNSASSSSH